MVPSAVVRDYRPLEVGRRRANRFEATVIGQEYGHFRRCDLAPENWPT